MDKSEKGTIALDIDGTLTNDPYRLPPRTVAYLSSLVAEGWSLLFLTGRTFSSAIRPLKVLPFPYFLAVQNGAIILQMPGCEIVAKKYLDRSIFDAMESVCQGGPSDYVIYSGFEQKDVCFFRPKRFSSMLLTYLKKRIKEYEEVWTPLDSYEEMEIDQFPSIKCFGKYPSAVELANRIETLLGLHVPLIRDPFDDSFYVVQATHSQINKGQALEDLLALTGKRGKVIAAGDDLNDRPMLIKADIKIVMATAPKELLEEADIIASPASEEGIIAGLQEAMNE